MQPELQLASSLNPAPRVTTVANLREGVRPSGLLVGPPGGGAGGNRPRSTNPTSSGTEAYMNLVQRKVATAEELSRNGSGFSSGAMLRHGPNGTTTSSGAPAAPRGNGGVSEMMSRNGSTNSGIWRPSTVANRLARDLSQQRGAYRLPAHRIPYDRP